MEHPIDVAGRGLRWGACGGGTLDEPPRRPHWVGGDDRVGVDWARHQEAGREEADHRSALVSRRRRLASSFSLAVMLS